MEKIDIIVIMPIYNEEKIIVKTINRWDSVLSKLSLNYKIEIYNDGSTDNCSKVVEKVTKTNSNVVLINNVHKGFSKTLYYAYKNCGDADYIFHADADNEISPEDFELLWKERGNADLVIARRVNRSQPIHRKIATNMAKNIIALLFSQSNKIINDTNVPFRLLKKELLDKIINTIDERNLYPNIFICAYCLKKQMRIIEIPLNHNNHNRQSYLNNFLKLTYDEIISFIQLIKYANKNF